MLGERQVSWGCVVGHVAGGRPQGKAMLVRVATTALPCPLPVTSTCLPCPLPAHQCISFVGRRDPELLPPLYRWTAAVLPALASLLRGRQHYMEAHLADVLAPAELAWLRQRGLPPIAALQV